MKKCILFLCLFFFSMPIFAKDFIVMRSKPHGMFSIFHFVMYFLQEYERGNISGLHVDFANTGLYYDPNIGPNWWEYYFEPIYVSKEQFPIVRVMEPHEHVDPNCIEFCNSLEENNALIQRYIKVKPHILQKVEEFKNEYFQDKYVIGVHYRGTDKLLHEANRVSYSDMVKEVSKVISKLPRDKNYTIFVATDEYMFLHFMMYRFGNKICFLPINRSVGLTPLHSTYDPHPYETGESALIDALLLSNANYFIRTSSNLSLVSRYLNPKLETKEMSQRSQELWNYLRCAPKFCPVENTAW